MERKPIQWLRASADRAVLVCAGIGLLILAVWALRNRQALAAVIAVLSVALLVLGVTLPRVQSFSIGVRGIQARLDRIEPQLQEIERKVNQIVMAPTIEARGEVFPPTIVVDPPPDES